MIHRQGTGKPNWIAVTQEHAKIGAQIKSPAQWHTV